MKLDREMAVEAMRNMGWTATREGAGKKVQWRFTRPDTGGLWDRVTCKQSTLSMAWVADIAMQHGDADDLIREVLDAKERWMKARFLGIFTRADGRE